MDELNHLEDIGKMRNVALSLRMIKRVWYGLVLAGTVVTQPAWAKNIVTADVPLDSKFYTYVDKLEAMGYIRDMTSTARPWSRYDVAKMVAKIRPEGMPEYLGLYYNELCDAFSDEIAYIIAHDVDEGMSSEDLPPGEEGERYYHADQNNDWVADKLELAQQSEHFPCNFAVRSVSSEISFRSHDDASYDYYYINGSSINGSFQALNSNNNGYRYGSGWNWVNELHLSGSLCNDVAVGITGRYSLDKDQHGRASLKEGYVRTHVGQVAITVGRQALQWGGGGRYGGTALSSNATPQTMVRLGLVEPVKINRGFFRFLGKVNATVFASRLDNREDLAKSYYRGYAGRETNDMTLVGMRAEIQPVNTWSLGLERVSMMRGFSKDWLIGKNAYDDDLWNDIAGVDTTIKFPGVHLYGSIFGEDQAGYLPTGDFYSAGLYLPQLTPDGRLDLRLEASRTGKSTYVHGSFINGWSYRGDILGQSMGNNATQYQGMLRYHANTGDIWSMQLRNTSWQNSGGAKPRLTEFIVGVDHRISKSFQIGAALGLARFNNYAGRSDRSITAFGSVKLNWNF